jgi:putative ABC transport system permease protein
MKIIPPKRPLQFLRWFCREDYLEEIEGDLTEIFEKHYERSPRQANWNFSLSVIKYFRPQFIKSFRNYQPSVSMFKNYATIGWRNLLRNKAYSFINITGLAVGIACSLVIFLFAYGEWSYDRGYAKGDRIYRIGISFFNIGNFAAGPERLLEVLPKEYAGIETATRIRKDRDVHVTVGKELFIEPFVFYTDTAFFKMFEYNFIQGSKETVLRGPNEIILTEDLALKYFNKTDALGEVIEIGKEKIPYTVTGVVAAQSFNSHLKTSVWLSIQSELTASPIWSSAAFYSYVLLRENQTEANLRAALDKTIETKVFPESGQPMGFKTPEEYIKNENSVKFFVHPLKDIYLKSKLSFELAPGGDESNIIIFAAIALFILLLASVNFINLTTARAARRAKEVGIRKTMGTSRKKLIAQFLLESMMTSTLAMVLALLLAEVFLLVFEYITGNPLLSTIWRSPNTVILFFGFSLFVGLLSGIYPALYLTAFSPIKVLKGNMSIHGGGGFRNLLVVFQFSVSIILIISAIIVQQQLHFVQTKDLGFNQDNMVTIDYAGLLGASGDAFKTELDRQTGVINSSYHTGEPGSKMTMTFSTYQTPKMESAVTMNTYLGDDRYMDVLGMKLVKGRRLDHTIASDTFGLILNETAAKALDLGENPIGAKVNESLTVIGIVKDFHWETLRNAIAPLAIRMNDKRTKNQLTYKLQAAFIPDFLKQAEARWKQTVPDEPFKYHFVDENFGELLKKEEVFAKAINIFTLLAILISCLGFYGLSAYTAEQRTKEIGIRKVLGASVVSIVLMLNKKFTFLILIAMAISIPVSIYAGQKWLQGFAYHIDLGIGIFLLSIVLALLVAWATVGYHSLKASVINPADTLKYE